MTTNQPTHARSRRWLVVLLTALAISASSFGSFGGFGGVASAQGMVPRLRWGIEGGAGGDWGTPRGPSVGLFGQLGLQLSPRFALFYQPSLFAHAIGTSDDADTFAAWGNLGMVDATIGLLQLGAGAGFDVGHFNYCSGNVCYAGERTVQPALGGRIAVVVPLPSVRGRFGLPLAFQIHSTFLDDDDHLTALLLTIGIQRY